MGWGGNGWEGEMDLLREEKVPLGTGWYGAQGRTADARQTCAIDTPTPEEENET